MLAFLGDAAGDPQNILAAGSAFLVASAFVALLSLT